MQRILFVLLMVVIAACQTPQERPAGGPMTTTGFGDVESIDLFVDWFADNIGNHCGYNDTPARDACVKTMLLSAFDETGLAQGNCTRDMEIVQFGECVIYGSFAHELLNRRARGAAMNWREGRASLNEVLDKTIAGEVEAACAQSELEILHVCRRRQLAEALELSSDAARMCGLGQVDDWWRCILNHYFSDKLAEAAERL